MDTKTKQNQLNKTLNAIRLDKAYNNYHELINRDLPYKFAYLDEWLLKKSKILLSETEIGSNGKPQIKKNQRFRKYARGTLIKADFGVNIGSEMSQVHFAIVINKYDNQKNNILTVVPLTSKPSKFNVDLGDLIIGSLIEKIKKELLNIGITEEFQDFKNRKPENETKIRKLCTLLNYYKTNIKKTYACCSLVTTISKERIFSPINEYDIIGNTKCSSEIMNIIDNEIIDRFTKNI